MPKLEEQRGVLIHAFSGLTELNDCEFICKPIFPNSHTTYVLIEMSLVKIGHIAGNQ